MTKETGKDPEIAVPSTEDNGGIPQVSSSFHPMPETPVVEGYVVPSVEVVAPANMPAGYQFSVDVNGRHMVVVVPEGGVKQNETFNATIIRSDPEKQQRGHNIPVGEWRDETCDCCTHGCCHPHCCLTLWMTPLALGQILTRLKLDWMASPLPKTSEGKQAVWTAFRVLFMIFIVYQFFDTLIYYITDDYVQGKYDSDQHRIIYPEDVPVWANVLEAIRRAISWVYGLLLLFITIRTRAAIRNKYAIPEKNCVGCEDLICGFFCGCCSICQMARHTADYKAYKASCCTETGLDYSAPKVV